MKPGSAGEEHLPRVRRLCLALPETWEKLSHGAPTFFVRKKAFLMFMDNHHNDGHVGVWLAAAEGEQAALIHQDPATYYRPPYVGVRGWVGIELSRIGDEDLAVHIANAWQLSLPKKAPRKR